MKKKKKNYEYTVFLMTEVIDYIKLWITGTRLVHKSFHVDVFFFLFFKQVRHNDRRWNMRIHRSGDEAGILLLIE